MRLVLWIGMAVFVWIAVAAVATSAQSVLASFYLDNRFVRMFGLGMAFFYLQLVCLNGVTWVARDVLESRSPGTIRPGLDVTRRICTPIFYGVQVCTISLLGMGAVPNSFILDALCIFVGVLSCIFMWAAYRRTIT